MSPELSKGYLLKCLILLGLSKNLSVYYPDRAEVIIFVTHTNRDLHMNLPLRWWQEPSPFEPGYFIKEDLVRNYLWRTFGGKWMSAQGYTKRQQRRIKDNPERCLRVAEAQFQWYLAIWLKEYNQEVQALKEQQCQTKTT